MKQLPKLSTTVNNVNKYNIVFLLALKVELGCELKCFFWE